jgi:hypothetical protein
MPSPSTLDTPILGTNEFYRRVLHVLNDGRVPFLVGGSHAFLHYSDIARGTKDFDLFVREEDLRPALNELAKAGYRTEISFPHWLGKAYHGNDAVDLVFNSGNGVAPVDDEWFEYALEASVLGVPVKVAPVEEFMWQKAFIMERERFDGADVMHLILASAEKLDWNRLLRRFGEHWELLLHYLILFNFVFPSERHKIPQSVMRELLNRALDLLDLPDDRDKVCRGTLISRAQYLVDIGPREFADARLAPRGKMTGEQLTYWTWAIDHIK